MGVVGFVRGLSFRLAVASWLIVAGIGFVAVSPASAATCFVDGDPGVSKEWSSTGGDYVAGRLRDELGVSLAVLGPALRWEIPVCVGPTGNIALAGLPKQVASSAAAVHEQAALALAEVDLMSGAYRPEPLLSPDRSLPQWAGLETWLAVDDAGWVDVGPVSESAGGVTVTVSGSPVGTVWTFADGSVVECEGPGELYVPGGSSDAPCGKEWSHSSAVTAHAVQVAVRYELSWSSSVGNSGQSSVVGGSLGGFGLRVDEVLSAGVWGERDRLLDVGVPAPPPASVDAPCSLLAYAGGDCDEGDPSSEGVDDGECGPLTAPIRNALAARGDAAQAVIDGIEGWGEEHLAGLKEGIGGAADWLWGKATGVAQWVDDYVVGHVVDAAGWVYEKGSEGLAQYRDEIQWVQGKAGEVWGLVDGAVIATANGAITAGGLVIEGAVRKADEISTTVGDTYNFVSDRADDLKDAIEASGIGDELGVGIEVLTGVSNGAADVAVAVGGCIVWIGQETYNAIPDAIKNLPILGPFSFENMIGCAKAIGGNLAGMYESVKSLFAAAADPQGAYDDFTASMSELIEAALEDPAQFAKEMGIDVLNDIAYTELRETHGVGQWMGALVCEAAAVLLSTFVSGGTLTAAAKAGKFGKLAQNLADMVGDLKKRPGDGGCPLIGGCSCNSFPSGTLVLLASGAYRPIEMVDPGEHVVTYNVAAGAWRTQLVLDQWSGVHRGRMVSVSLAGGAHIRSTSDHSFWVEDRGAWVAADLLLPGDLLLGPSGATRVESIVSLEAAGTVVWELDTAVDDNFVVATVARLGYLVHNSNNHCVDPPDPGESPVGSAKWKATQLELETGAGWTDRGQELKWIDDGRRFNPNNPDSRLFDADGNEPPSVTANPDYLVDGKFRDVYSPLDVSARNAVLGALAKVERGQTQRVDINLGRSELTAAELVDALRVMIRDEFAGDKESFLEFHKHKRKGTDLTFLLEDLMIFEGDVMTQLWPLPDDGG